MQNINCALDKGDPTDLLQALQNENARLPSVMSTAASLYFEEFKSIKKEKQVGNFLHEKDSLNLPYFVVHV